jgi:hypothetical protein
MPIPQAEELLLVSCLTDYSIYFATTLHVSGGHLLHLQPKDALCHAVVMGHNMVSHIIKWLFHVLSFTS